MLANFKLTTKELIKKSCNGNAYATTFECEMNSSYISHKIYIIYSHNLVLEESEIDPETICL